MTNKKDNFGLILRYRVRKKAGQKSPAFFVEIGWAVMESDGFAEAFLLVVQPVECVGKGLARHGGYGVRFDILTSSTTPSRVIALGCRCSFPFVFFVPFVDRWCFGGGACVGGCGSI